LAGCATSGRRSFEIRKMYWIEADRLQQQLKKRRAQGGRTQQQQRPLAACLGLANPRSLGKADLEHQAKSSAIMPGRRNADGPL
jgi:hypothetical protein